MNRLFVAVALPEAIRDQLSGLKRDLPCARWVKSEQMHLTLRFIGEVDDSIVEHVQSSLGTIKAAAFEIVLEGCGYFPPRRDPRVLWVGINTNQQLAGLYEKVEQTLVGVGLEPEKRAFSPHITLARLNKTPVAAVNQFVADNSNFKTAAISVNDFRLYASTLHPQEARYQVLASYPLAELATSGQ